MNLKFFLFLTSVFLMFTSGINAQEFTKAYGNANSNMQSIAEGTVRVIMHILL
jgi:hypothetical protein